MIAIYINTVLCSMLFYTCFCRLVRTDDQTYSSVKLAFCILAGAAGLCMVAPFKWGYTPQWPVLVIEAAMALVQALTANFWRDGVPAHFQRCACPTGGDGGQHG